MLCTFASHQIHFTLSILSHWSELRFAILGKVCRTQSIGEVHLLGDFACVCEKALHRAVHFPCPHNFRKIFISAKWTFENRKLNFHLTLLWILRCAQTKVALLGLRYFCSWDTTVLQCWHGRKALSNALSHTRIVHAAFDVLLHLWCCCCLIM